MLFRSQPFHVPGLRPVHVDDRLARPRSDQDDLRVLAHIAAYQLKLVLRAAAILFAVVIAQQPRGWGSSWRRTRRSPNPTGRKFLSEAAEDTAWVVGTTGSVTVPCETVRNVLTSLEAIQIEPGLYDQKVYAPGTGTRPGAVTHGSNRDHEARQEAAGQELGSTVGHPPQPRLPG